MRKLSWFLVLALLLSIIAMPATAESEYSQSPMLDAAVEAGELPPVEERLPENPKLAKEILDEYLEPEIGKYGGTLRFLTASVNWDADIFIGNNEALLSMSSTNSGEILPNVVESYAVNDEQTEFTFTLRKGLKWSDGVEVTMEDFRFTVEDFIFNETLTPIIAKYMRDGNSTEGAPFVFEIVDDTTFKIKFTVPYGGFLVYISAASWVGYTDLLKPAHYLKPFHLDYAEECHGSVEAFYEYIKPFAEVMGYNDPTEEGVWMYVFNQIDMTNWECTDPNDTLTSVYFDGLIDKDFPHLYPWKQVSSEGGLMVFERNPYYFKVDADGNQLPYFDRLTSSMCDDSEMIQMRAMAGDLDFMREFAGITNISLYRENEESAGFTAYVTVSHMNPLCFFINMNYGLNTDGTVKDDDASKAWQEVVNMPEFRKAIETAIDAEEILDAVYNGFAEVSPRQSCTGDFDAAREMLDGIGMVDTDGDGYRETPSGLPFVVQAWIHTNATSDNFSSAELFAEYMAEIGLNITIYATEDSLLSASQGANEVPMRVWWNGCESLWFEADWYKSQWAPLWANWYNNAGNGLEPPQEVKDFYSTLETIFQVSPEIGSTEVFDKVANFVAQNGYMITPLTNAQQCVVINSDIGNVPTGGIGIGWDYSIEQMFYYNPDQH